MDDLAAPPRLPVPSRGPVRRAATWFLGPPATALLGVGFVGIGLARSWWLGAAVLAAATVGFTAAEAWGRRVGGDGPEWRPLRWGYAAVVAVATVVFVVATGEEFYLVTTPAVVFVPAVAQAGRGVHARRAARGARPGAPSTFQE